MRMTSSIPGLLALLAAPVLAQAVPTVPGFADLERWHARDRTDALARERIAANIPVGASLAAVRQGFTTVGGRCRDGKDKGALRCLIHQMSMANRSFDDVRWTIVVQAAEGRVTGVSASRYVDRHLTS